MVDGDGGEGGEEMNVLGQPPRLSRRAKRGASFSGKTNLELPYHL